MSDVLDAITASMGQGQQPAAPAQPAAAPQPDARVLELLANPPAGMDVDAVRKQLEGMYPGIQLPGGVHQPTAPVPTVAAPAPTPIQPAAAPAPVAAAPTPIDPRPDEEKAPKKRGRPSNGLTKADRMKLACAALQGGTLQLDAATAFVEGSS